MSPTPEPETTQSDDAGTIIRDNVAGIIFDSVIEDPEMGLLLGSITLVVVLVWTVVKSIFELFGGPSQSLFG